MLTKTPRAKDAAHLRFIRELPCAACGDDVSVEAAHIRTGEPHFDKRPTGMGEKPDDKWVVPLCGACHRHQHYQNEMIFWEWHHICPFQLAAGLWIYSGDHERCERIIQSWGAEGEGRGDMPLKYKGTF